MRFTIGAIALLVTVAVAGPAIAQQESGDAEIQFSGTMIVPVRNVDDAQGFILTRVGYFATDSFEVGGGASIFIGSRGEGISASFTPTVFVRGYLDTQNPMVFPYIEGSVVFFNITNFDTFGVDNLLARPAGGIKYFLNERTALDINFGYGFQMTEVSTGTVDVNVGFAYVF